MLKILSNFSYQLIFCCIISYLIGSINWALVICESFFNKDIRELGSGNPGATNVGRIFGKKYAILVVLLDASKALLVYFSLNNLNYNYAIISTLFVAIGHCFPIYTGFKGGKGVACFYGIIFALNLATIYDFVLGFVFPVIVYLIILKTSKLGALASLISVLVSVVVAWVHLDNIFAKIVLTLLFILIVYRHKENLRRIITGSENKI